MAYKIAAVVVTYNRKELLVEALSSLINQTYSLSKIIIIDNNSTDDTNVYLKEKGFIDYNNVLYIRLNENLGGSGGFYYGIKYALKENIDYISLSDDDAMFNNDFFEKIIYNIKKYPEINAFTGTVKTNDKIDFNHRRYVDNKVLLSQENFKLNYYLKESFYIDIFSFVGCVINANIIKKIGLPKKDFFIWYDDTEYSLRVGKETKILNISNAIINHKTKLSDKKKYTPNWKEYYGLRNQFFMILEHTSNKWIVYFYIFFRMFKMFCASLIKNKYRGFRKYRICMLYDIISSLVKNKRGKNIKYLPN